MTKSELVKKKIVLQEMIDTLTDIEQGMSVSCACNKRQFNPSRFYKKLEIIENLRDDMLINPRRHLKDMLTYTERFYLDFFNETSFLNISMPADAKETVDYLIALDDSAYNLLRKHYKENLTYERISKDYNVSRQAIQVATKRLFNKLRIKYSDLMKNGISEYKEMEKAKEKMLNKKKEEASIKFSSLAGKPQLISINELDLSTRSRGVLFRLQIKTIEDLLSCPYSKIRMARNIGVSSMREILDKTCILCRKFDINFADAPLYECEGGFLC